MSRGQDRRETEKGTIAVLNSIRGHDSTIAHSFNHTEGRCPKCGNQQHMMMFCLPGGSDLPRVRGCELDGEHLHRICGACRYPWIERPLDQAMLAEREGRINAESELAAALAVILERSQGAELDQSLVQSRKGWVIEFTRDPIKRTLTIQSRPAEPQTGTPSHPSAEETQGGGA